jgi:hypothetical protein
MGKRSRLHREAVIAGAATPFRQGPAKSAAVTLRPPIRGSGQTAIRCASCTETAVAIVGGRALCVKHLQELMFKKEVKAGDAQASKKDS